MASVSLLGVNKQDVFQLSSRGMRQTGLPEQPAFHRPSQTVVQTAVCLLSPWLSELHLMFAVPSFGLFGYAGMWRGFTVMNICDSLDGACYPTRSSRGVL